LNEYVQECTTELVFNLDEVDISDWCGRKMRNIGVLATIRGQMIHDTSWNILKCQVYFGDCLCLNSWKIIHPLHNSIAGFCFGLKEVQEKRCWVRNGFGLEIESEAKYQRRNLVDYIRTVFLSNLAEIRPPDEFAEEMTVLLMDNWSSHMTSDVVGLPTEVRVRIITFAPCTTHIFQIFDVILSNVLKQYLRCELAFEDEEMTIKFLMKVYHGFKQIMVDCTRWRVFKALVLEFGTGNKSDKFW
jgi:hypothetical protein